VLVLVAGATPHMLPLQEQTWDTFSVNWETDTRLTFHWSQQSLLRPLRPGSRVIVISSGAAIAGSPLSGGYAGAKMTQRFIAEYAQDEADRAGLEIVFTQCYANHAADRRRRTGCARLREAERQTEGSTSRSLENSSLRRPQVRHGQSCGERHRKACDELHADWRGTASHAVVLHSTVKANCSIDANCRHTPAATEDVLTVLVPRSM